MIKLNDITSNLLINYITIQKASQIFKLQFSKENYSFHISYLTIITIFCTALVNIWYLALAKYIMHAYEFIYYTCYNASMIYEYIYTMYVVHCSSYMYSLLTLPLGSLFQLTVDSFCKLDSRIHITEQKPISKVSQLFRTNLIENKQLVIIISQILKMNNII